MNQTPRFLPFTPKLFTELAHYNRQKFLGDLFAGLTVGVVALPLAMAFAIASGLPPERGLFTAIVAGLLISLLGGSRVQIGGPTGAFVVIVSGIVTQHGYSGLVLCTLMAGMLLVLMGIFRMGGLIKFIPFPVITGFTTGIALTIFSTQIPDLFGLSLTETPSEFLDKIRIYAAEIPNMNPQALLVSLISIASILLTRRLLPKVPALLMGMVVATVVVQLFHLDVETIGSRFGDLPRNLPRPQFPSIDLNLIRQLSGPALVVALLAAIESLLSATVADGMTGGRHRPDAELIATGVGNLGSALFGGIPATGAIARTATNVKSGGRTPVAGMIHAITLALLLLLCAPVAKLIPLASMAGILTVVSYNMSELHHFKTLLRGPRSDALVLVLTFLLTVLVDLTVAVQVGVVLSSLLFMRRMAEISHVEAITGDLRTDHPDRRFVLTGPLPHGVEIFEVTGSFFFGMIDRFHTAMRTLEEPPRILILCLRDVYAVDATAIHALRELCKQFEQEHTRILFSDVRTQPLMAFEKAGLLDELGIESFPGNLEETLNVARELLTASVPEPE